MGRSLRKEECLWGGRVGFVSFYLLGLGYGRREAYTILLTALVRREVSLEALFLGITPLLAAL